MQNFNVFYSFHYEDVGNFKANIIRNSSRLRCYEGLLTDKSIWEEFKAKSDFLIKNRIDNSPLKDCDVTVVLIGQGTHERRWVKYEIIKSIEHGNSLISIHINRIKGRQGITKKGLNPFERLSLKYDERKNIINFYELNNGVWKLFEDLPFVKNKSNNSIFVKETNFFQDLFGVSKHGLKHRLSDFFPEYTWNIKENNAQDLHSWILKAHRWVEL